MCTEGRRKPPKLACLRQFNPPGPAPFRGNSVPSIHGVFPIISSLTSLLPFNHSWFRFISLCPSPKALSTYFVRQPQKEKGSSGKLSASISYSPLRNNHPALNLIPSSTTTGNHLYLHLESYFFVPFSSLAVIVRVT